MDVARMLKVDIFVHLNVFSNRFRTLQLDPYCFESLEYIEYVVIVNAFKAPLCRWVNLKTSYMKSDTKHLWIDQDCCWLTTRSRK